MVFVLLARLVGHLSVTWTGVGLSALCRAGVASDLLQPGHFFLVFGACPVVCLPVNLSARPRDVHLYTLGSVRLLLMPGWPCLVRRVMLLAYAPGFAARYVEATNTTLRLELWQRASDSHPVCFMFCRHLPRPRHDPRLLVVCGCIRINVARLGPYLFSQNTRLLLE